MRNLIDSLIDISKYANICSIPRWQIVYFNDRVQKDVLSMPSGILADYLRLTEAMALYGADLRMPHSRALGAGLFELRPKGPEGIGRVFYCTQVGRVIVILHSFIKKTQETPDADMRMARKRLKEIKNG
ncbi:MAG: type II toxin-antitoxin system RelE/ParE family toxin [Burkholderiales bacterium]|nr:type II toxin-antitoxin system RelE/ParE family toxin [Burkholderiales bacterium]